MTHEFGRPQPNDDEPAALTKEMRVRVLNCSASGCLIESNGPVAAGTVAVLRIAFGGLEFDDTVQVVRCQPIEGAGSIYHVGAQFLPTTPPYAGTLRYVMRREVSKLAGWLRPKEPR